MARVILWHRGAKRRAVDALFEVLADPGKWDLLSEDRKDTCLTEIGSRLLAWGRTRQHTAAEDVLGVVERLMIGVDADTRRRLEVMRSEVMVSLGSEDEQLRSVAVIGMIGGGSGRQFLEKIQSRGDVGSKVKEAALAASKEGERGETRTRVRRATG